MFLRIRGCDTSFRNKKVDRSTMKGNENPKQNKKTEFLGILHGFHINHIPDTSNYFM